MNYFLDILELFSNNLTMNYRISQNGTLIDQASTETGAHLKAIKAAQETGARVLMLDQGAGYHKVCLWEFRPYELFARPVRVKH